MYKCNACNIIYDSREDAMNCHYRTSEEVYTNSAGKHFVTYQCGYCINTYFSKEATDACCSDLKTSTAKPKHQCSVCKKGTLYRDSAISCCHKKKLKVHTIYTCLVCHKLHIDEEAVAGCCVENKVIDLEVES